VEFEQSAIFCDLRWTQVCVFDSPVIFQCIVIISYYQLWGVWKSLCGFILCYKRWVWIDLWI